MLLLAALAQALTLLALSPSCKLKETKMPKIVLENTSLDAKDPKRFQEFEPIDAREVLGTAGTVYKMTDGTRNAMGLRTDAESSEINIPQMQGDPEMQTGIPGNKYGREAVVMAEPGMPNATAKVPMTTQGVDLSNSGESVSSWANASKPEETLTVAQIKEHLNQKGVAYHSTANKAELLELYSTNK